MVLLISIHSNSAFSFVLNVPGTFLIICTADCTSTKNQSDELLGDTQCYERYLHICLNMEDFLFPTDHSMPIESTLLTICNFSGVFRQDGSSRFGTTNAFIPAKVLFYFKMTSQPTSLAIGSLEYDFRDVITGYSICCGHFHL